LMHGVGVTRYGSTKWAPATWSGVVWPWLRRPASAIEWFSTFAASGVRVCWIVLSPALISESPTSPKAKNSTRGPDSMNWVLQEKL